MNHSIMLGTLSLVLLTFQAQASAMITDEQAQAISCDPAMTIPGHMSEMGNLIRTLNGYIPTVIDNKDIREEVLQLNQKLRAHLVAVFNKTPGKIKDVSPNVKLPAKVVYQRYIHKLMGITIELEHELLKTNLTPLEQQNQNVKVAALIVQVQETVDKAHDLFRF